MTWAVPLRPGFSAFSASALARHREHPAVITAQGELSYRELASRVADAREQLDGGGVTGGRRLVLVAAANTTDILVMYLAALSAGHVVLLAPGDNAMSVDTLVEAYDPDVVVRPVGAVARTERRRVGSAHTLHPELALLLSTSGSTGSPKLVRLSYANLQANAESIAEYLGIGPGDRAATTLPMSYCYGLSVIHSHLVRGATLILTSMSVVDRGFWELFRAARATSLAAVPYTFDLLDRVGFDGMALPHLRYVTQAGGRLAPDRVARYARLGQRQGWDLVVMYGQTEATARMAYLPPHLAVTHPHAIGVPVPGGSFRLEPVAEDTRGAADADDVGELVYSGPNVMMGYAHTAADLALGRTLDELRTGDLARRTAEGLYEIVGRRTRFGKLFGLRIDLQHVEDMLAGHGFRGCCATDDGALHVVMEGTAPVAGAGVAGAGPVAGADVAAAASVQQLVARTCRLPESAVRIHHRETLPRLANGKLDLVAVQGVVRAADKAVPRPSPSPGPGEPCDATATAAAVRRLFADRLGRHEGDITDDSTFVSLGGDSLTYVELSLRLEEVLGNLPADWPTTALRDLAPSARCGRARLGSIETTVLLRAIAIVLVVGTHANTFDAVGGILGGAHLLIAVAGYNFARFHLTSAPRPEQVRGMLRSVVHLVVPSMLFITALVLVMDEHGFANIVLLNSVFGPEQAGPPWEFWFIEALVQILLALAVLFAVPAVDLLQRRFPFGLAVGVLTAGLLTRFDLVELTPGPRDTQTSVAVLWLFALGWAAAAASTVWRRLGVTALALLTVPGFFANSRREDVILGGLMLLLWVRGLPCPRPVRSLIGLLASSSLYIYLTHWQVFPALQDDHPVPALVASLALGLVTWKAWSQVTVLFRRLLVHVRTPPRAVGPLRAADRDTLAEIPAARPSPPDVSLPTLLEPKVRIG
ncbi:AMP-binding protein [Parafrankia sp. FMc2]|uniref:AMP-binding protein n=1 Tax=Parafrankia sp. FMc2 TaxID=3233196 RepID=UPI0034D465A1